MLYLDWQKKEQKEKRMGGPKKQLEKKFLKVFIIIWWKAIVVDLTEL